ncbi:hypothetical protein, partial [Rhodopseudomonas sp. BR0C11]|uniref:hypothetical protein n=1 Tax=Rhodopseudomonas sp. BR0C11 TaxID=2269370 RepID=UPI0032DF264B
MQSGKRSTNSAAGPIRKITYVASQDRDVGFSRGGISGRGAVTTSSRLTNYARRDGKTGNVAGGSALVSSKDEEKRVAGRQRIDRVRRQYNQWVANQTLEDYALRFTAKSSRRWSAARVANTALGAISFLALEAIGGTITLNYGVTNATAAILVVSVSIF